jgi:DnaJ-class molecular chaperone
VTRQQGGGGARFTFGGQDPHDIFKAFFGEQGGADLFGGAGQVTVTYETLYLCNCRFATATSATLDTVAQCVVVQCSLAAGS